MSYAASFYFDIFAVLPWGLVKRGPRDGQLKPDNWMDAWMFERLSQIVVKLQECLKDIKASNFLLLNTDRTEVTVLIPKKLLCPLNDTFEGRQDSRGSRDHGKCDLKLFLPAVKRCSAGIKQSSLQPAA